MIVCWLSDEIHLQCYSTTIGGAMVSGARGIDQFGLPSPLPFAPLPPLLLEVGASKQAP